MTPVIFGSKIIRLISGGNIPNNSVGDSLFASALVSPVLFSNSVFAFAIAAAGIFFLGAAFFLGAFFLGAGSSSSIPYWSTLLSNSACGSSTAFSSSAKLLGLVGVGLKVEVRLAAGVLISNSKSSGGGGFCDFFFLGIIVCVFFLGGGVSGGGGTSPKLVIAILGLFLGAALVEGLDSFHAAAALFIVAPLFSAKYCLINRLYADGARFVLPHFSFTNFFALAHSVSPPKNVLGCLADLYVGLLDGFFLEIMLGTIGVIGFAAGFGSCADG